MYSCIGPSGTVPSRLHTNTVKCMLDHLMTLNSESNSNNDFSVFHEFSGLGGVLAIDAAVYNHDELLAFIEIDGESHYKQFNQVL